MIDLVHIVGGGLAGSEAAWQLAQAGVKAVLHEMRPVRNTEAHKTGSLAELVCSNSFRSDEWETNAVGLLHEEMRRAGSLVMRAADANKLPAGGALAVDREGFAAEVTNALEAHPLIVIAREEIVGLPPADWQSVIVATGPLTSQALARAIQTLTGEAEFAFFDAIAPIVHRESIDMGVCWLQSRYDKVGPGGGGADYINCALDKDQYEGFIAALLAAEKTAFKDFEGTPYFEGCLPIEVMAERGPETLRFGPMKPVGLTNTHQPGRTPPCGGAAPPGQCPRHAVEHGRLPNQTQAWRAGSHLPHDPGPCQCGVRAARRTAPEHIPQQSEAARRQPSPERRQAASLRRADHRGGGLCRVRRHRAHRRSLRRERAAGRLTPPPPTTALGALLAHITGGHLSADGEGAARSFQPMNVNFGLFPPLAPSPQGKRGPKGLDRKRALAARALADLDGWLGRSASVAAE